MPFTPFHMGPGMALKAVLQNRFSLTIFGLSQIVIDIQPLIIILTRHTGRVHGITHTIIVGTFLAIFSAVIGKPVCQFCLNSCNHLFTSDSAPPAKFINITWPTAFVSALLGIYSHLLLDTIMHSDMRLLYPFSNAQPLLGAIPSAKLYSFCVTSGGLGLAVYCGVKLLQCRPAATSEKVQ